ncbi:MULTISPECIES: hypothetical protein [unclassified Oceanispirochaeta]|nr:MULTISPECIES: hypothetical protein [unclassified Oceanispirochaeta]MBF9018662.1 hypothetical protein [Oceanispirochaeta sp. M2]NPD75099.1 hypothetical protein [Oceanispirochaeta sp. M1]RDG29056.1 hypothetical protein DV872_23670 [Oceanispirochaeta sp. M1]
MIAVNSSHKIKARIFKFRNIEHPSLNEYGMEAQKSSIEDDYQAFLSIQVERYLKRKTQQRFCSEAEKDVINQIIADSWTEYRQTRNLSQIDTEQKIRSYYSFTLVFPYFVAEEECIISFDFRNKCSLEGGDECFCNSGVPYRQCCGGIKSLKDLLKGSF